MANEIVPIQDAEVVLYQPDDNISLEVKLEQETVWLSQAQMVELFQTTKQNVSLHINNIFKEGELTPVSTVKEYLTVQQEGKRTVQRKVTYYNLDVIISVGYRVKSQRGTQFRIWATGVLKQYLLQGYAVNRQLIALQERMDERMTRIEDTQHKQQQQLDFFIRTSTPPAEMVFFNGEFFTARVALENLIKTARTRAIIIDGYIDAKTFDILGTRAPGVLGQIYTVGVGAGITRLRDEHNRQNGIDPIQVFKWRNESHDRWLIIDDQLWHCGHSLNALGGKMSAITLMGKSPDDVLAEVQ